MSYLLDERVAMLREMENSHGVTDDFGLLNACIHCLKPSEAILLLSQEVERSSKLRNGLLRKVSKDLQTSPSLDHSELANRMIIRLGQADARGRQGLAIVCQRYYRTYRRKFNVAHNLHFFALVLLAYVEEATRLSLPTQHLKWIT